MKTTEGSISFLEQKIKAMCLLHIIEQCKSVDKCYCNYFFRTSSPLKYVPGFNEAAQQDFFSIVTEKSIASLFI